MSQRHTLIKQNIVKWLVKLFCFKKAVKVKDFRSSHCYISVTVKFIAVYAKHHTTPPLENVIYMCSIKSVLLVVEMMKSTNTVAIKSWDM